MAEPLENAFEKLTGRAPTGADRERLYRARDALGLPDNDALWLLLIALDYHQSLYEQIPSRIGKLLEQISIPRRWVWLFGGRTRSERVLRRGCMTLIVAAVLAIAAGIGHHHGYTTAQQDLMARYDLAAASWASSPEGRRVRVLAENGMLAWAESREGRVLRELTREGLLDSLWSRVGEEQPDVALVRRADAEWLASRAGQRARVLTDDATLAWLDSPQGRVARRLVAALPPDALAAGVDLAVVPRTDANWLQSEAGQRARALTEDGTLAFGEWLRAMVHNGLIVQAGEAPAKPIRCKGVTAMGFQWRESGGAGLGKFCDVWHGYVSVSIDRIGKSRRW